MNLSRRQFLRVPAGAVALPVVSRAAWSQAYPTRPVKLVVGFAAGGSPDIVARMIAQPLSERLGQQFIIENRPGAGTNIAIETVVKASPDGYTLLYATTSAAINATLYDKLNYNFIRDISPVAGILRVPNVMVIHPSVPANTVPEFVAYAKANPGKLNMAAAGIGGSDHVSGELFKMMTGVDMVPVPYRGGGAPLFADLLSGKVQVAFGVVVASLGHIKSGKLRALAVTTAMRSEVLPDVPAMAEFVPGYEASSWHGLAAPRNTPADIRNRLNREVNAILSTPEIKARLSGRGGLVMLGSPDEFWRLVAAETEKWAKVVRFAGMKSQ
jgi:tripartite-type tricarboxylate transporter receptor subunit TctC